MGANSEDPDMPGQPGTLRPSLRHSKTRYHPITKTKSKLGGQIINLGSLNVRTLRKEENFEELEEAFEEGKLDILGMAEIRREGESIMETKRGNLFYYMGQKGGQKGVGFLINKKWKGKITEFQGISDRISRIKIQISIKQVVSVIQVYAPTSASDNEEINRFYESLFDEYNSGDAKLINNTIIVGDFNGQVGGRQSGEEYTLGPYGCGSRNARGEMLIEFCQSSNLQIVNTFFKKRKSRSWTWISPNMEYKNQIDFMLAPLSLRKSITDCEVDTKFKFHSDHRLIRSRLQLQGETFIPKWQPKKIFAVPMESSKSYEMEINKSLQKANLAKDGEIPTLEEIEKLNEKIMEVVRKAAKKKHSKKHIQIICAT